MRGLGVLHAVGEKSQVQEVGDTSTLANPDIVDDIRHHVQSEKLAHGEVRSVKTVRPPAGGISTCAVTCLLIRVSASGWVGAAEEATA